MTCGRPPRTRRAELSSMSIFTVIAMAVAIHSCYIGSKVLVSLTALSLGASPFSVGLLAACYAVFPLLLGVYTGRLTDRRGVRMPLFAGSALTCAAMVMGFFWRVASTFTVYIYRLLGLTDRPFGWVPPDVWQISCV